MRATLIGVRQKIDRAKHHFFELSTAISQWGTSKEEDGPFFVNHHPDRKNMVIRLGEVRANDPAWPLIVGDIVHNLRSALDHLVCQLAILNGNDISCCASTYFPICICRSDFKKANRMIEPLLTPVAFADIETLQPYNAPNVEKEPSSNNLWVISKLDIIDKHRMLLIVGKYFRTTDVTYRVNEMAPVKMDIPDVWRPLENGAHIATIDLSQIVTGPEDKMRVQGGTEVQVFFNETGSGCDGLEVGAALIPCINYVSEIVDYFEARYFTV
jgi:hypothetical protein